MDPGNSQPAIVICGLGKLGQACLKRLRQFDVPLQAMDRHAPDWRDPELEHCLAAPVVIGDMRRPHHLRQAGVDRARAVLLLSSESTTNLEAALQVRLLNPTAQIVVRASSDQRQLGDLLEQRLNNLTVVDPINLMRWALLQALRPGQQAARFEADGQGFAVFASPEPTRRDERPLLLDHPWPGWRVKAISLQRRRHQLHTGELLRAVCESWKPLWQRRRQPEGRPRRMVIAIAAGMAMVTLIGIIHFSAGSSWQQGVFVTLALLKGEFVDPVNVVLAHGARQGTPDGWLISGSLVLSLLGTLLTSALVAVILDRQLSARFGLQRKPRLPRAARPILLVGQDNVSGPLSRELQREGHSVWAIDQDERALEQAQRLLSDRDVLAIGMLSHDLLINVQGGLALQKHWPGAKVAMLASAEQAAEQLGDLLGGVTVISNLTLAADVMVATAFGERVEGVWPIGEVLGLLVRYTIDCNDSLCGRSLARVQNGFGVTAIALRRPSRGEVLALPPVDLVLSSGDQLLILASLDGLRRIELNRLHAPAERLRLRLKRQLNASSLFEVHRNLARYLGCSVEQAHELGLGSDWIELEVDPDIAALLVQNLGRLGLELELGRAMLEHST